MSTNAAVALSQEVDPVAFAQMASQLEEIKDKLQGQPKIQDKMSMVVFSGDLDKVLAALIIATGAAAMGMEVVMFFTFWGTAALRDAKKKVGDKDFMSKMFGWMLPKGADHLKLSKMNMGGMGTSMLRGLMKKKNTATLAELFEAAAEMEVKINVCEMSMDLMGFKREELIDYPDMEFVGVATFLGHSGNSVNQLFI